MGYLLVCYTNEYKKLLDKNINLDYQDHQDYLIDY